MEGWEGDAGGLPSADFAGGCSSDEVRKAPRGAVVLLN